MDNSKAYKSLVEQINATGSKKMDGYNPKIMEEIYEEERGDAENLIWNAFHKNKDMELAQFMPELQFHDGVNALKEALKESKIPSSNSVNIACVLYKKLKNERFLDIIKQNIVEDPNNVSYVAILAGCKPCEKLYKLLCIIYMESNNRTIRSTAVIGILYNKGFITNPYNTNEIMEKLELRRKFLKTDKEERKNVIKKMNCGEFDDFK